MNDRKKFIGLTALVLVLTFAVGVSFAYFTAQVLGNSNASETVITTGNMSLIFTDGPTITASNLFPGQSATKTFTVQNNGDVDTYYDIYLSRVTNDFANKEELICTLSYIDENSVNQTVSATCPSVAQKLLTRTIAVGVTQSYTLTIEFLETHDNQDDNKGKTFTATISINEYENATISAAEVGYSNALSTECTDAADQTVECALDELTAKLN